MKIGREGNYYKILKNDGSPVILTVTEAGILVNFVRRENLRELIEDVATSNDGEVWNLDAAPDGRSAFLDEIFSEFEDEIDYGNSVSEDDIYDKIVDLATFYDMML